MGIPLLGLIPKIIKTAASILGVDSVKDVVDAIEGNKLTPDQRVALDAATKQYALEMRGFDIEELKASLSESIAMIQSSDKYTSRARPTMLYAATGVTVLLCLAIGIAVLRSVHIDLGIAGIISSMLLPLWGAAGWYVHSRTKEKMNGNGNGD